MAIAWVLSNDPSSQSKCNIGLYEKLSKKLILVMYQNIKIEWNSPYIEGIVMFRIVVATIGQTSLIY